MKGSEIKLILLSKAVNLCLNEAAVVSVLIKMA